MAESEDKVTPWQLLKQFEGLRTDFRILREVELPTQHRKLVDQLDAKLVEMRNMLADLTTRAMPLIEAAEGEQDDRAQFSRALRIAIVTTVISVVVVGLVVPLLTHLIFGK